MRVYMAKAKKLSGSDFHEVKKKAFDMYLEIKGRSKRKPYVRSAYFGGDKVFLSLFWSHLWDKQNWQDRMRRLKFFAAAIELIQHSRFEPKIKDNPNKHGEILYRFAGSTKEKELFFVQIKGEKNTGKKYLISMFPYR